MDPYELGELRRICARLSARTEIRDLRFEQIAGRLVEDPLEGRPFGFDVAPSISHGELEGEYFSVTGHYAVNITRAVSGSEAKDAEPADERIVVAEIVVDVAALFRIDPAGGSEPFDLEEVTDEELSAYARSMGLFALHPYARQAVSNLTTQLGLPTLTLPALRIATGEMGE